VPYVLGAGVTVGGVVSLIVLGFSFVVQPAREWTAKGPEAIRQLEARVRDFVRPLTRAAAQVEDFAKPPEDVPTAQIKIRKLNLTGALLGYTRDFLVGTLETLVLLFFLLASGDEFLKRIVRLFPSATDKQEVTLIVREVQQNVSTFMFAISLINIGVGVVAGLALAVVGLPNPILWGVTATLLNFIPYLGPVICAGVLTLAGLLTFEGGWQPFLPPLLYLAIHAIESNVLTPLILGRRLTLNPVIIFVSLLFWTWIWGVPGALLSVPFLMMAKVICEHFQPLERIGNFIGD